MFLYNNVIPFPGGKPDSLLPKFYKNTLFTLIAALVFMLLTGCKKDDELNPEPTGKVVASAGTDQTVQTGTTVTLDGSASKDNTGKQLTYSWIFTAKPVGSQATLTNATQPKPTFVPDLAGVYETELTISSTSGQAKDKVSITVVENTTAQLLSGEITTDRVLSNIVADPTKPDYIVTADLILKAKLTINPGVVIEFDQDKSLIVLNQGTLIAKGNTSQKVIFTGKSKTKGFWKGIILYSASNEMDQVTVEYAGSSDIPGIPVQLKSNITLLATSSSAAALKISNTSVSNSGGFGLYVHGTSQLTEFLSNSFANNTGSAMFVPANQVYQLDAASSFNGGNGFNGVQTRGILNQFTEVSWPVFEDGSAYYVDTDLELESGLWLPGGITLKFNPGVVMRIKGAGYLQALGSVGKPVIFTAHTQTQNGYWGGIYIESASTQNKLDYTEVSYAGNKDLPQFGQTRANIAVASTGKVTIHHSTIKHGLGWGIAAFTDLGSVINEDVVASNTFEEVSKGKVKLTSVEETTTLAGEWVDAWTLTSGNPYTIDEKFFDQATNTWFRGGADPWSMQPQAGFGLKIATDGTFLWTIAEYGPWAGCGNPYSAEYIKGSLTSEGDMLHFQHQYWRSKFYNPCDTSQSVDTMVEPTTVNLRYEISRKTDATGKSYWQLKLINPDNSSFIYYKR